MQRNVRVQRNVLNGGTDIPNDFNCALVDLYFPSPHPVVVSALKRTRRIIPTLYLR